MLLVVEPDLVWVLFCWSVYLLITGKNPSWVSPFIHLPRFQLLWLNPTIVSFQRIPSLNTPMLLFFSTMKPSMTSAGVLLILSVPLTPTSIALSLRYILNPIKWILKCLLLDFELCS